MDRLDAKTLRRADFPHSKYVARLRYREEVCNMLAHLLVYLPRHGRRPRRKSCMRACQPIRRVRGKLEGIGLGSRRSQVPRKLGANQVSGVAFDWSAAAGARPDGEKCRKTSADVVRVLSSAFPATKGKPLSILAADKERVCAADHHRCLVPVSSRRAARRALCLHGAR